MMEARSYKQCLEEDGYVVLKQVIPHHLIDRCLRAQRKARHNPLLIFRGQGVVGYEKARWNAHGQMVRSIQNPHLLGFAPSLSRAISQIVFSEEIATALTQSSGTNSWVNWQTMLFDRSVGTDIHLDTWFLDTDPKGFLVGAWIALEDIQSQSGPFIVYPRSHYLSISREIHNLTDLTDKRNQLVEILKANHIKPTQLLLKKGDIVLWNSLLAHGSELPISEHETRKSVTAHFYPHGMQVKDPPIKRCISIYNHKKPKQALKDKLYISATINPLLYSCICIAMLGLQRIKGNTYSPGSIRRA